MQGTSRFLVGLTLVALGAAAFAIAFRASLSAAYAYFYDAPNVLEAMAGLPVWLVIAVPGCGGLVAGLIVRARSSAGQNVSNVMEAVALGRVRLSMRATAVRTAASWAAISTGLSIGRVT